jgi:hypothetical protein
MLRLAHSIVWLPFTGDHTVPNTPRKEAGLSFCFLAGCFGAERTHNAYYRNQRYWLDLQIPCHKPFDVRSIK